jgi:hypothetical protein
MAGKSCDGRGTKGKRGIGGDGKTSSKKPGSMGGGFKTVKKH